MTFAREETGFKNINPSEPIAIEWTNRRLSKLSPVISYYFRIRRSPAKSFQQPVRLRHVFTSPSEVSDTIHHLQAGIHPTGYPNFILKNKCRRFMPFLPYYITGILFPLFAIFSIPDIRPILGRISGVIT